MLFYSSEPLTFMISYKKLIFTNYYTDIESEIF